MKYEAIKSLNLIFLKMRSKIEVYYIIKNTNFTVTRLRVLVIYIECI